MINRKITDKLKKNNKTKNLRTNIVKFLTGEKTMNQKQPHIIILSLDASYNLQKHSLKSLDYSHL